jgi:hypothetical protein
MPAVARSILSVGEYANGSDASLAQGFLGEDEIEADLAGVHTQAWAYGVAVLTNVVRVEVRAEDAPRARGLLTAVDARIRARVRREIDEERGRIVGPLSAPEATPETGVADAEYDWEALDELPPLDRAARRVYVAAILGLWVGFIMWIAFVLWLLLPRADELGPQGRRYRRIAGWLLGAWLASRVALVLISHGVFWPLLFLG